MTSILTVGKLKERYLVDRIAEYVKRIGPYAKVQMIKVPDDKAPESMSPAEEQQVRMKESNQLAFVICGLLELSSELPHKLMRLVLVGQVYRVMRINRGEPYHK
ncbi:hypothetical protein GC098_24890 [Paenibacillus sp. LMG 31458]|uniref:23S rRNA (Pseudouridine(1915)-N(3))-methyltransferase RlmH n=1 Tax=Paenibacillus phytorum TaxID=2654977 RepID=A0ABX1Y160_9BACL|nr:23S rRNA (pseudouridine(1915)-N(3))-methyltransferase RlmH [Paenibacillus phytorum]NOU74592.1 hypothetical protein [Paenibacillus phytorum]